MTNYHLSPGGHSLITILMSSILYRLAMTRFQKSDMITRPVYFAYLMLFYIAHFIVSIVSIGFQDSQYDFMLIFPFLLIVLTFCGLAFIDCLCGFDKCNDVCHYRFIMWTFTIALATHFVFAMFNSKDYKYILSVEIILLVFTSFFIGVNWFLTHDYPFKEVSKEEENDPNNNTEKKSKNECLELIKRIVKTRECKLIFWLLLVQVSFLVSFIMIIHAVKHNKNFKSHQYKFLSLGFYILNAFILLSGTIAQKCFMSKTDNWFDRKFDDDKDPDHVFCRHCCRKKGEEDEDDGIGGKCDKGCEKCQESCINKVCNNKFCKGVESNSSTTSSLNTGGSPTDYYYQLTILQKK